ncbi:MAG: FkbM family methyltransferase [Verrucomicrobiota bacterium]
MNRAYWRVLVVYLPQALVAGRKKLGWRGVWLALCTFLFRGMPFPVRVQPHMHLSRWHEAVNYMDNFILGELEVEEIEAMLRTTPGQVIEVGVNIGVTTRWWLGLNPQVEVVGVDMIQEALDTTTRHLEAVKMAGRWQAVLGAVGDAPGSMEIHFDDPLEGTNSLDKASGSQARTIEVNTLDAYLERARLHQPLLLKLDIEGHAAAALRGAARILSQVRWVVIETHHRDELCQCADLLTQHGYHLRHFHGRTMAWRRG